MINRLKFLCGFSILLLCGFPVCAQNANRLFESVKLQSTNLEVNTNDGQYIIVPYSENIIETNFIPKGEVRNLVSHAIDQKQKQTNINVRFLETQTTIEYASTSRPTTPSAWATEPLRRPTTATSVTKPARAISPWAN